MEHLNKIMALLATFPFCQTSAQDVFIVEDNPLVVQLRSNMLFDAMGFPSIGVEMQTDFGMTWQLDYAGAWWNNTSKDRFYSGYAFRTAFNYYTGAPSQYAPYRGHHVGIYGTMATYDFAFGNKGYQSPRMEWTFTVGLGYGYTLPLSKKLSIDFAIGVGYFQTTYNEYIPFEDKYAKTGKDRKCFFGPTDAALSLIWNINAKNEKEDTK